MKLLEGWIQEKYTDESETYRGLHGSSVLHMERGMHEKGRSQ
jgi:hypothetical protein